jgi:glycosyltransferase involved in cell wall biosynthesis
MRITWYSNAPWAATGYGQQTAQVVSRLKDDGHAVAVTNNYGLYAASMEWEGITVFPAGKDKFSNDVAPANHVAWRGDWLITLYDVWPLRREMFGDARIASWVPIDHDPVPVEVADWCKTVTPIAMSRFGQRMLKQAGIESIYIPHGIDTQAFQPREATSKGIKPREAMKIPADAFVVIINAANQGGREAAYDGGAPPRKAWGEMFTALAVFMRKHSDTYVYLHTDRVGIQGVDLEALAHAVGLPFERVHWADPYALATGRISQVDLAAIYSAGDVLLSTSMGEGFGIPVVEAQACGLPVIVTNFSAQPELVGAGWTVEGQPFWDAAQGSWFCMPYIPDIVMRLEESYAARGDEELITKAIAKGAEYDADRIYELHWKPFIAQMEAQLVAPVAVRPNRAQRRAKKARRAA